ncbi:GDSL esterase/lipase At4g10955-like [Elaeis guineensis]|uniref:GDSL esterase/lipase At4g10955-like n=1 Tax=Elaeis guineensis var. tenera TaxID=51953 RepID=A0A6I9R1U2_ELAGV|nr:GDSL esterase/lipase At4g10955-like [Elaeis guineensis]
MAPWNTKQKPKEKYVCDISGPKHLPSANWACPSHRRTVAACLVQGAYALEYDRQTHQNCAPAWWRKFDFELKHKLIDAADSSIFGAIYEFEPRQYIQNSSSAPKIVIAFRGTLLRKKSFWQDIKLDLDLLMNDLSRTRRSEIATTAVVEIASAYASRHLWLAGHSLGSAIAMLAGKNMAKRGINLETFLFNPPHPSSIFEWIQNQTVKQAVHIFRNIIAVAAALAKRGSLESSRKYFAQISFWIPHLFVNSDDFFCSGYIRYFENREYLKNHVAACIGRLVARHPSISLFGRHSEPFHLLPSANLLVSSTDRNVTGCPVKRFKLAHGICQWWSQDLSLQSSKHHYS